MQDLHRYLLPLCTAILAAATLTFAGCGGGTDDPVAQTYSQRCLLAAAPASAPQLLAPTGPHCIGKEKFLLSDPGRPERFTTDETDVRELNLKVWYPAPAVGGGGARAGYLDPRVWPLVRDFLSLADDAPAVATNAQPDLPMQADARYPVVLFSPGLGLVTEGFTTLLEDLASHGYVVVAIDHPYVSGPTVLASGEVALTLAPPADQFNAHVEAALATMVADQRQVLDWLQAQNQPGSGSVLAGHLDLSRIGAYGHSIGGATALQAARADDRIRAAIDIDGTVFGGLDGAWQKPLMFVLAGAHGSATDPSIATVLAQAGSQGSAFSLATAEHNDFSDVKFLLDHYAPGTPPEALAQFSLGSIASAEALRATREKTLGFFDAHLRP